MRPIMFRMSCLRGVLKFPKVDHVSARYRSRHRIVPKPANAGKHNDVGPSWSSIFELHNHLGWANNIRRNDILEGAGIQCHNAASGLEQRDNVVAKPINLHSSRSDIRRILRRNTSRLVGLEELETKLMTEEERVVSKSRILENEVMNERRIAHGGKRNLYDKESRAKLKHCRDQSELSRCITFKSKQAELAMHSFFS